MLKPVLEMEKILADQREIYGRIFIIEEKKSDAIMKRDGKILEKICHEEERLIARVTALEEKRNMKIQEYARLNGLDDQPARITLQDIIHSMDEDSSHHLLRLGMELKTLLLRISGLHETNSRLISDSVEFYNILLSSLKKSSSIELGYTRDGRENGKIAGSVIFNKTA